ncbi:hypothetical protein CON64_06970, partial [Bacillus pseudomycoides]
KWGSIHDVMLYKSQLKKRHKNPFLLEEDERIWPYMEAIRSFSCHMQDLNKRKKKVVLTCDKKRAFIS